MRTSRVFFASALLGSLSACVRAEVPILVDAGPNLLIRHSKGSGSAYLFADNPRFSAGVRGAVWLWSFGPEDAFQFGPWLGYRYEPGPAGVTFERRGSTFEPASRGVRSWMLSHDLSAGPALELGVYRDSVLGYFFRTHAGAGLSLATLQLDSLDDGHVYSETEPGLNLTATAEVGGRFNNGFQFFIGTGYLWANPPSLTLTQDDRDPALAAAPVTLVEVPRHGHLYYAGIGLEF